MLAAVAALRRLAFSESVVRAIGLSAICLGFVYLVWLFGFALDYSVWWLALPLGIAHLQAYITGGLFLFGVWHHDIPLRPPSLPGRTVDVLIPTLNEPFAVLAPTVIAACDISYPHRTYVLDDGHRSWVEELCRRTGAIWVTRPSREHAKGGNLNRGTGRVIGRICSHLGC
jgi:cellulose synthase (UDP-forming)